MRCPSRRRLSDTRARDTRRSLCPDGGHVAHNSGVPQSEGTRKSRAVARSPSVAVTAVIMTYNHAEFIGQAVQSVLMQELGDRYEILIVDDCSTDATLEIARSYADRHPELIRVLASEQNMGRCATRARAIREARGTYVALLDGDDYWTSPHKLRKQSEFLDSHPECAICFHNATVVYHDGSGEPHAFHAERPTMRISSPVPRAITTLEDIAVANYILTMSVMFRNGLIAEFPDWYFDARMVFDDWVLYVLLAEHGHIGYLHEILSVYRVHRGGAWSDQLSHFREPRDLVDLIWIHDRINEHLGFRYDARIRRRTAHLSALAARLLAREGELEEATKCARRSLSDARNAEGIRGRIALEILARRRLAPPALVLVSQTRRAAAKCRRVAARLLP
jgi:glycosyltransferase involved in cell wall biosynthesis